MLPIELTVRVEPGAQSAFGSGILIGPNHVLTCAHVIDPDYSKGNYVDPDRRADDPVDINDRPDRNVEMRSRLAGRNVEVVAYDGTHKGSLVDVHPHQDLVLLRLSTPVRHGVRLPPLQTDYAATRALLTSGLGFRRTQQNAFSVCCESLTLTAPDNPVFEARSTIFQGQASEGMSGGPVMAQFDDGGLKIIGMLTMGGSTQAACGVVRADTLFDFVKSNLGEAFFAPRADGPYGLAPDFPQLSGKAQTAVRWLPLPRTRPAGDADGQDPIRFIASRPLTFADLDAVTGHRVEERNQANRKRFFAPMTIDEAQEVAWRFTETLGERFSIPDRKAQDSLTPPDRPAGRNGLRQAADPTLPELVLAPEWEAKRSRRQDGAVFPAGDVPEWVLDGSKGRLAFADPEQSGWEIAALPGSSAQTIYKGLLRPMLTIPVWAAEP